MGCEVGFIIRSEEEFVLLKFMISDNSVLSRSGVVTLCYLKYDGTLLC